MKKCSLELNEKCYTEILYFKSVPNSINLLNIIKEELDDKIQTIGNRIKCLTITGDEFIQYINNIYDKRKIISI